MVILLRTLAFVMVATGSCCPSCVGIVRVMTVLSKGGHCLDNEQCDCDDLMKMREHSEFLIDHFRKN